VQGVLQLVPGSVGHVPDVRDEASGDRDGLQVCRAHVRPVRRWWTRRVWGAGATGEGLAEAGFGRPACGRRRGCVHRRC